MGLGISPTEQQVYKQFYKTKVLIIEDVSPFLKDYRKAVLALNGLSSKQYAKKIKRGLYSLIPFEESPDTEDKFSPDKILVANKFTSNSFLSHHTALEVHGAADKEMYAVFITTANRVPSLVYKGVKYLCIKTEHFFGFEQVEYSGCTINVSDKERTIIDCLRNVNYGYGFDEIKRAVPKLAPFDFEKMFSYLKKIDEVSLFARVGYTFSLLKTETAAPDWFLDRCRSSLTNRTYYLDITKKGNSRHFREWKLMVPL